MQTQPSYLQDAQVPQDGPEIRHCRMTSADTAPKLDGPEDSTDSTPSRYEKTLSSYDQCRIERQEKFLAAQKLGASTTDAARLAGVHRSTPYVWRHQDPEFAQAWRESRDTLIENLEMEAYQRALKGNDRMLAFLLKSHKPQTYNQRQHKPADAATMPKNMVELIEKLLEWI